jgi:hypothetical protein
MRNFVSGIKEIAVIIKRLVTDKMNEKIYRHDFCNLKVY